MAPQDAGGDRVKRAEPHPVGSASDHRLEALLHLARRLVGEGDGQDFAGIGAPARQDMRQPRRQYPRLAGAGAGQHQHGAVDRLDGAALRLVEAGVERHRRLGGERAFGEEIGHAAHHIATDRRRGTRSSPADRPPAERSPPTAPAWHGRHAGAQNRGKSDEACPAAPCSPYDSVNFAIICACTSPSSS